MTTLLRPLDGGDERGSATLWMVFATVIVLAVAGLVFDGGTLLNAKREAMDQAEQAARAGAQEIDPATVLAGGAPHLDRIKASERARAFLNAQGLDGSVVASADSVTVTVTRRQHLAFLQTLGLPDRSVAGTATARPEHGLAHR